MTKTLRKLARELFLRWRNPSRYIIERKILPRIKNKKVLLVGCADYCSHYPKKLRKNNLWTMDIDPEVKKYGSKNHLVGDISKPNKQLAKDFDIILFLGIFGFGLNNKKDAEKAIKNLYHLLKPKGLLIIQWVNLPNHNQVIPQELKNFKLFKPIKAFGYPSNYKSRGQRIFEFLLKE